MLRRISMLGGLLIMMGHHARSEALFYYFRLEDQIPENHLLRLIDKHISFEFVRQQLKGSDSDTGRPSIDPELLLRMLLIGYLYGITSERKLVEQLRMHLAWRWFTGLRFDQEIPHHSTFSKNRRGRFQESKLFEQVIHNACEFVSRGRNCLGFADFAESYAAAALVSAILLKACPYSFSKTNTSTPRVPMRTLVRVLPSAETVEVMVPTTLRFSRS
jgi:transposase